MIIGLGNDMIDIRRVERTIERYGERFLNRVFTDIERQQIRPAGGARRLLRQALRRQGSLRQSARHRLPAGRVLARHGSGQSALGAPDLELTGGAALALARITPDGHEVRIDLSITDDFPTAQAIVIISAYKISMRD